MICVAPARLANRRGHGRARATCHRGVVSRFPRHTRASHAGAPSSDYRATGTGMMAKPIAIPGARITAAIIIATDLLLTGASILPVT